jgi:hypothetical protein
MVKVSYGGDGSNNGGRGGGNASFTDSGGIERGGISSGGVQSFPPYSLGVAGFNYRPPVRTPRELLPLSRLPRTWTYTFTNKNFPDFSKKMRCSTTAEKTREVKNEILKVSARPTAVYKMETPIKETFETKYSIKNPVSVSATSGFRTMDITNQEVKIPVKHDIDVNHYSIHAQQGSNATIRHTNNSTLNTDKYIQNAITNNVNTNKSQNISRTPINEIMDLTIHTKNPINVTYTTPKTSTVSEKYIHEDIELQKRLPQYQASTNFNSSSVYKNAIIDNTVELERNTPLTSYATNTGTTQLQSSNDHNMSRDVRLNNRLYIGGFENAGQKPAMQYQNQQLPVLNAKKLSVSQKAAAQLETRYS